MVIQKDTSKPLRAAIILGTRNGRPTLITTESTIERALDIAARWKDSEPLYLIRVHEGYPCDIAYQPERLEWEEPASGRFVRTGNYNN